MDFMSRKSPVGQLVDTVGTRFADRVNGIDEVVRPIIEGSGDFSYRIRDAASESERAAGASQVRAADPRQEGPPQAAGVR